MHDEQEVQQFQTGPSYADQEQYSGVSTPRGHYGLLKTLDIGRSRLTGQNISFPPSRSTLVIVVVSGHVSTAERQPWQRVQHVT